MPGSNEARRALSRFGCDLVASGLFVYGATLFFLPPSETTTASSIDPTSRQQQRRPSSMFNSTYCESNARKPKLIFLGTGSSTGCPRPLCSLLFQDKGKNSPEADDELKSLQDQFQRRCRVSNLAIHGDPRTNKDYRNNPSLLIHHYEHGGPVAKNVIIDVGKTFRETALRWLPHHGVRSLDAVILTHHHMDAVAGLDDLRGFQSFKRRRSNGMDLPPQRVAMPIYLSQECLEHVSSQFPWLFPAQQQAKQSEDTKPEVKRDVAALEVNVVDDYVPFHAGGLKVTPLPVWHGDDLISLGFSFSLRNNGDVPTHVVYISDISKMVPETLSFILERLPPTDILVVDALFSGDDRHPVHFNLTQAKALSRQIGAKQTFLVGMSCDSFPPHDEMNRQLSQHHDTNIQFAHDGLAVEV